MDNISGSTIDQLSHPRPRVFINFRAADFRDGFISHLVRALRENNIKYYIDEKELRSEPLEIVFKRIRESQIALVFFTEQYAKSEWCLEELVEIMKNMNKRSLSVIPVFFKVKPEDVKDQKKEFGVMLYGEGRRKSPRMPQWEEALESVPTRMGMIFRNESSHLDFLLELVKTVKEEEAIVFAECRGGELSNMLSTDVSMVTSSGDSSSEHVRTSYHGMNQRLTRLEECLRIREELEEPSSSRRAFVSDNGNASGFPIEMLRSLMIPFLSSMAASSSHNDGIIPPQYQVFINFRGDELRYSFVGFLAKAMRLAKINVFIDEAELRGTKLQNLFKRIEESRVALAIFSERYTESCWCLDELVKMKEQMEKGKLVVIPVFYRLDATKCKRLVGAFGDHFRNLEWDYRCEPVRIQRWKEALSSVFDNIGLNSDIRSDESKFVDLIVDEVKRVLIKIFTEEREF